ncbi:MAG: potassium channel family protein [Pseudosphingobacterium sp.]|nr:potassium channel family protein [Pseudosphingobacterium sp.]
MKQLFIKRKYELLLFALMQHLYMGALVSDIRFYIEVLWPINMLILSLASIVVFMKRGRAKTMFRNVMAIVVITFPILLPLFQKCPIYMFMLNLCYVIFFVFIFLEVFRFLVKPSYINTDIISAAACGVFLIIEIFVFVFQLFAYHNHTAFKGLGYTSPAYIFTDLVYYCSITFTTIGYGDITPNIHNTKLIASLIGVIGQFYSVVLLGILISKFTGSINSTKK